MATASNPTDDSGAADDAEQIATELSSAQSAISSFPIVGQRRGGLPVALDIRSKRRSWGRNLASISRSREPAREWKAQPDLPFVSLSIPGAYFDPRNAEKPGTFPLGPVGYRYDLAYCDEVNALAQPPRVKQPSDEISPAPDSPPSPPAVPLERPTFAKHWKELSERASLASADGVTAFEKVGVGSIPDLVGKLKWPVKIDAKLEEDPVSLTITDAVADPPVQMVLTTNTALEGISGHFATVDGDKIRLLSNGEPNVGAFEIVAGAMAAYAKSDEYVDQRGLARRPTVKGAFLRTSVSLGGVFHALTTALAPISLSTPGGSGWQFWFRDLPFDRNQGFERHSRQADPQDRQDSNDSGPRIDANDPESLAPERDYLSGYEWRLAEDAEGQTDKTFLRFFHLEFRPLSLERVVLSEDQVQKVEIIGRLQLPIEGAQELDQYPNAVRLVFLVDSAGELRLQNVSAECGGEWPLSVVKGEAANAPTIVWKKISYQENHLDFGSPDANGASLNFTLFGEEWSIRLNKLAFSPTGKVTAIPQEFPGLLPADGIGPVGLKLALEPTEKKYSATLEIAVTFGEAKAFEARVGFPISPADQDVKVLRAALFEDLSVEGCQCSPTNGALQFSWQRYASTGVDLQMLPGMHLETGEVRSTGPGYATITFHSVGTGVLQLVSESAFLEVILLCRWGEFLAGDPPSSTATKAQVFGSSAGDLAFGFTTQRTGRGSWQTSLLVNGMLEVKNLVSWPKTLRANEKELSLFLPALNPGTSPPRLDHIRHTLRILFNQHVIPAGTLKLDRESGAKLLFNFARGKSWQFLAVVEHQLVDVLEAGNDFSEIQLNNHRRWTAVQEVRLVLPETFKNFLKQSTFATQTESRFTGFIDPVHGVSRENDGVHRVKQGYLALEFQRLLNGTDGHGLDGLTAPTLLVEASAVHWIEQESLVPAAPTSLQFLPNGIQSAVQSNPQDFAPGTDQAAAWQLLSNQFLGRLQDERLDGIEQFDTDCELVIDPILRLARHRSRAREFPISLGFSSWALGQSLELKVSAFDWNAGRVFLRLDPNSLEESWFRLANPLRERGPATIESVMASYTSSPARLSRSLALRYDFDSLRSYYPPGRDPSYQPPNEFPGDRLVWRRDSLLVPQAVAKAPESDPTIPDATTRLGRYPWAVAGLQITTAAWSKISSGVPRIHAAVTLIPTLSKLTSDDQVVENPMPLGLAVSPYVAISFTAAPDDTTKFQRAIIYAELLCLGHGEAHAKVLDPVSEQLRPVATRLLEKAADETDDAFVSRYRRWASEAHSSLAPDSPIAILRLREIRRPKEAAAQSGVAAIVDFAFEVVRDTRKSPQLLKRVFRMRAPVTDLRFREGQFGGFQIPGEMQHFELAPPLVTGAQPFRLETRPGPAPEQPWPWGVSGVSVSLQITREKKGLTGNFVNNQGDEEGRETLRLWWHAPQQFLQYRTSSTEEAPAAGLPETFRAPAIKCLLPTLPSPPMPGAKEIQDVLSILPSERQAGAEGPAWQPILPGALRYLVTGSRGGAFLAIRSQLLTQTPSATFVSGSVPMQLRAPRPVSLPANESQPREKMLQTWGSFFEPGELLMRSSSPTDEAFYAPTRTVSAAGVPSETPAMRVRLELLAPEFGGIRPDWNGEVAFDLKINPGPGQRGANFAVCNLLFELVGGGHRIRYKALSENESKIVSAKLDDQSQRDTLKDLLQGTPAGKELKLVARIKLSSTPDADPLTFYPILSFTLRMLDPDALRLPLRPVFTQFEDPEYNRLLSSQPARAAKLVILGDQELSTATLATDRREYNPDSDIALRYDVDSPLADGIAATVKIFQLTSNGLANELVSPITGKKLEKGTLYRFSLGGLTLNAEPAKIADGEILQLRLSIKKDATEIAEVTLDIKIVSDPVVPPTQSAYALLRISETGGTNAKQAECTRFAWAPAATRIDLVNAEDLRGELVRRRAVFQWTDSFRRQIQRFDLNQETLAALREKKVSPPVLKALQERLAGKIFIGKEPLLAAIQAETQQAVPLEDQLKLQSQAVLVGPKSKYVVQKITANGSTHFPT